MTDSAASFIGGMNVPAVLGRANATVPLAELIIDDRTLTLRPRGIGRVLITDFVVGIDQIAAAFRSRGTIMTAGSESDFATASLPTSGPTASRRGRDARLHCSVQDGRSRDFRSQGRPVTTTASAVSVPSD